MRSVQQFEVNRRAFEEFAFATCGVAEAVALGIVFLQVSESGATAGSPFVLHLISKLSRLADQLIPKFEKIVMSRRRGSARTHMKQLKALLDR